VLRIGPLLNRLVEQKNSVVRFLAHEPRSVREIGH
jgi:hypothetical protein